MTAKSDSNIYASINPDIDTSHDDDLEDPSLPSLQIRRVLKYSSLFVVMAIVGVAGIASLQKHSWARTQNADVIGLYTVTHDDYPKQLLKSLREDPKGDEEAYLHSTVPDEYESVGIGACRDIDMVTISKSSRAPWAYVWGVKPDGSSSKCAELCHSHGPTCTGYMTSHGKCSILTNSTFWPASADGTPNTHCFWRHRFLSNTQIQADKPVTKRIWAFWQSMGGKPVPYYVQVCVESWKVTNPDWSVTLLNMTNIWDYVTPEELPKDVLPTDLPHTSDAVRMAILIKYGGVWMDATVLMLKPLEPFINLRPYMYFTRFPDLMERNKRVTSLSYVENWFFAMPPGDILLSKVQKCVRAFHVHNYDDYITEFPGNVNANFSDLLVKFNYSSRHIQDLYSMGIWSLYLSMHMCHYRILDEDVGIGQWWRSAQLHHLNATKVMEFFFQDKKHPSLFEKDEHDVFARVTGADGPPFLKFDSDVFQMALSQGGKEEFWCKRHTFRRFLDFIGMKSPVTCPSQKLRH